jgi:universal stress protein A
VISTTATKRILVPADFSAGTQATLSYACEYAKLIRAELHLLHVVPARDFPLPLGSPPGERTRLARQRLERLAQSVAPGDLPVVCEVRTGKPAAEVVRYARERDVGLIAMSTHGRTALAQVVMGSVAERVVREAPCPVLVIRPQTFAGHRADLSEAARRLRAATGAELVGDRQETWGEMCRLLTREFDLEPDEAARLLGMLEAAGAVVWEACPGAHATPSRRCSGRGRASCW